MNKIHKLVFTRDTLVQGILKRFAKRSNDGIKKYGKTMLQATKSIAQWIDDAQEESWDKIVYLEKIKIDTSQMKERIKELEQSLSIGLKINGGYRRELKKLSAHLF